MTQPVQMIDVKITGNSNNPISNQTARSLQDVIMYDYVGSPLIVGLYAQPLQYGIGNLDPYRI